MRTVDVVITGGGIAGNFLARQLKLARPELSILLLEAQKVIDDFKVGESTVEVAAHYMIRRLGLGTYLYQHQLPKNGLRFFFDRESKDLPLPAMSEIGSDHMPFHPSFQLDRAALERDVARMNVELGVDVELGAKVTKLELEPRASGSPHRVTYERSGEAHEVAARWVCDASGRRHLVARTIGMKVTKEHRLQTGAAWGRYRDVAGLDAAGVGDDAWRARVRHTSRHLSTNHMMYDGYWIWFIPLANDVMSVGAVFDKERVTGPRTRAEFEAFVNGHRASRDLMAGATFVDFQAYAHLPYFTEKYFSTDRWALTGEAGAFTDPFYSPGSDFIATANEFIASLVLADLDGDPTFEPRVSAYDTYYRFKYESTLRLYARMYPLFGSFELYRLKYLLDFNNYYNLVVWSFMAGKLTDLAWHEKEARQLPLVLKALDAMAEHFVRFGEHLRQTGQYFAQNEGRFANGLNGVAQFEKRLGPEMDEAFRRSQVDRAFGSVFATLLDRMSGAMGIDQRERVLSELQLPQVMMWRDLSGDSAKTLLERVAKKIEREVQREFALPAEAKLRVAGGELRLEGAPSDVAPRALEWAREAWERRGESLTHVVL